MNTILWGQGGYYAIGIAFCLLVQATLTIVLLWQRRQKWKRAEEVLRFQKALLESQSEAALDGILVVSPEGRILSYNHRFIEMCGISPEVVESGSDEVALESVFDQLVNPDDFLARIRYLYAHPDEQGQDEISLKDGRIFERYTTPIKSREGETYGRIWFFRDITDRKHAEKALLESKEKFSTLFRLVPVGIGLSSLQDGKFLEVNEAFLQAGGYTRDEIIGKTSTELNLWTDPAGRMQVIRPIQQQGFVRDLELELRTKSGASLTGIFSSEVMEIGHQQYLISTFLDITDRKQAEEALRESETKFRTIFENAPVSMTITRVNDGTYLDVNRKFVESTGFPKSELISRGPSDPFVHILSHSDFEHLMRTAQAQDTRGNSYYLDPSDAEYIEQEYRGRGKLENFYFRSYTGNGHILHNLISAYPVTLQGEVCALSIITDITELKQAEELLREHEERSRSFIEQTSEGVVIIDKDGRIIEWNPASECISGFSRTDVLGQFYWDMVIRMVPSEQRTPERHAQLERKLREALQTGQPFFTGPAEYEYERADGERRIIQQITFPIKTARGYRLGSISHDITERRLAEDELRQYREHLEHLVEARTAELQHEIKLRKHTEQSLRESEGKYRLIAENATDVIWTLNSAREYTYISPSIQQLRGYTPEEVLHTSYEQSLTPESRTRMLELIAQKRADDREPSRFEVEELCKDGSTVWVEVIGRRLYNDQGQRIGVVGISRDIRDRKRAEDVMKQAKEAAESASRAKSMFLSNMSHELRTPLNVILGFAQLLVRETTLSSVQREYLGTINRSGEHLLKLINNVLDMSKIEAGRMILNHASFDLWQMLTNIEEMIRVRAEQKGLQFRVERPPDVPRHIVTDEGKLRQVLINLLGNAVKFTETGHVALHIRAVREPPVVGAYRNAPLLVTFEISDTGPGIAPEDLPSIFEAFRQTSRVQGNEGTGLGLTLSRKFVQLLGGDIQVHSEVGRGSTFTFEIQVELADQDSMASSPFTRTVIGLAPGQSPMWILVADDHAESRQMLTLLLRKVGFDVTEATNGQEAVTLMKQWSPHLILMDIRMPLMDGYEATRKIRKLEEQGENQYSIFQPVSGQASIRQSSIQRVPIIALTASAFEEEQPRILAAGCDAVLRKPISTDELFEMLRTYLDIEYVYADDEFLPNSRRPIGSGAALTPDALAALPDNLIENLEQAVIKGNRSMITQVVEAICVQDAHLAEIIAQLVQNFKYQAIWNMIQQVKAKREQ